MVKKGRGRVEPRPQVLQRGHWRPSVQGGSGQTVDLVGVCWTGGEHFVYDVAHYQVLFWTGHCSPIELSLLQTFHEEDRDQSSHQHVLRADFMTDKQMVTYLLIVIHSLSVGPLVSGELNNLLHRGPGHGPHRQQAEVVEG